VKNQNLDCLLAILTNHGPSLRTEEILKYAKKYPELCKGCSSGTEIILAGKTLVKQNKISRNVARGGFVWTIL
jgi:hypothetical protein